MLYDQRTSLTDYERRTSSICVGDEVDNLVTDVVRQDVFVLFRQQSLKTIKQNGLTFKKELIVFVYSFNRFVDQEGDARSIDPFSGSETSNLNNKRLSLTKA